MCIHFKNTLFRRRKPETLDARMRGLHKAAVVPTAASIIQRIGDLDLLESTVGLFASFEGAGIPPTWVDAVATGAEAETEEDWLMYFS